jgi:hypothetical protein
MATNNHNVQAKQQLSPNEAMWYTWNPDEIISELERCIVSPHFFVTHYIKIFSNDEMAPIPFHLWDTDVAPFDNQVDVVRKYMSGNKIVALKARQLGMTWLFLALFLHSMLFRPNSFILLISRGEAESIELLRRMKQMYKLLPEWMKVRESVVDSKTEWKLSNESNARALSTRKGDSYTASHVLIDEADLIHESGIDLRQVLLKVEPTIGQMGKLVLLSKSDKRNPDSTFKNVYRGAMRGESSYTPIFCPYNVHPSRTPEWWEQQSRDELAKDGTLDSVWENYPRTPDEALAPNQSGKRFRTKWLDKCRGNRIPVLHVKGDFDIDNYPFYTGPVFSKLKIYEEADPRELYVIGVDPSAGAEKSDPSPIVVMKLSTMEDVAIFDGIAEPTVLGGYVIKLAEYYNKAKVLVELNNHGHSFIMWMRENAPEIKLLRGWAKTQANRKIGWEQSKVVKTLMFDTAAEMLRTGQCIINDEKTRYEISLIDEATLKAPVGQHEDCAIAYFLCLVAVELCMNIKVDISFVSIPR